MEVLGGQTTYIQGLTDQMGLLSANLGTQGSISSIRPFQGDPTAYKTWISDIDKYALIFAVPEHKKALLAYQTARGVVSEFIGRCVREVPGGQVDWRRLKKELAHRFGDIVDPQYALALLQKERQKKDESVQFYAERIVTRAEEAFPDTDLQVDKAVERQLLQIFIDGLAHDFLKIKLLRENPDTFQKAVEIATHEQDLKRKIELRVGRKPDIRENPFRMRPNVNAQGHEPMEVDIDHARRRPRCFLCDSERHLARDCPRKAASRPQAARKRVSGVSQPAGQPPQKRRQCYKCGAWDHIQWQCPTLNA